MASSKWPKAFESPEPDERPQRRDRPAANTHNADARDEQIEIAVEAIGSFSRLQR
jgi:hypothetical protein